MVYKIKLFILKQLMVIALSLIMVFKGKAWYKYYAMKWLRHYLIGSGKVMEVPSILLQSASSAFNRALRDGPVREWRRNKGRSNIPVNKYCVSSSVLYEGRGFDQRPPLFYVLGGFSFRASQYKKGGVYVSGTDWYDWHATSDGDYHCSSIGESPLIILLLRILNRIFGNELFFPERGWPMGNPGISNKLWEEFLKVGAKPFASHFEGWVFPYGEAPETTPRLRRPRSAKTSARRSKQMRE